MNRTKRMTNLLWAAAAVAAVAMIGALAPAHAEEVMLPATARAGAIGDCMEKGKTENAQSTCVLGVALLAAIEKLGDRPTVITGTAGGVIVQQSPPAAVATRSGWDKFGDVVLGTVQFAKDTAIALANPIAQVLVGRRQAQAQEVMAGFQRDTQIATVQGFTTMGGQIQQGTQYGYNFVQAPGAVTTNTLSGYGVIGGGTYTAPVTTTTTTDSHANPAPTIVTCVGTPPVCTR